MKHRYSTNKVLVNSLHNFRITYGTSNSVSALTFQNMKRVCIYPKDVSTLTGKSLRNAQKILQDLKIALKKGKNQYVTIAEFATYAGIDITEVEKSCASIAILAILTR